MAWAHLLEAAAGDGHDACGVEEGEAVEEVRGDARLPGGRMRRVGERELRERVQRTLRVAACTHARQG